MGTNCSLVSFFCMWISSVPGTIYRRGFLFSIVCLWLLCQNSLPIYMWVYSWALNSVPMVCVSVFSANSMLFWLSSLCSIIWSQGVWYPWLHCLFGFLSGLLWLFTVFCGSTQIWWLFVLFLLKYPWDFNGDYIKSVYCFGKYGHLTYADSSHLWTWNIFPFNCIFLSVF